MILALDPGPVQTGWAITEGTEYVRGGIMQNADMLDFVRRVPNISVLAIEMIASYGMAVGAEVFNTCTWIGRFEHAWFTVREHWPQRVFRQQVKLFLCHSPKAKDANVRQAILDLYPSTGGGQTPQVGTKKKPGPLFGVSSHVWPALGVALYTNHHAATSTHYQRSASRGRARLFLPVDFVPLAGETGARRTRQDDPDPRRRHGRKGSSQRRTGEPRRQRNTLTV